MKLKVAITFIWICFVATGFHFLMSYSGRAGDSIVSTTQWPAHSNLQSKANHHLVMFVHPGCSCSRASLTELSKLMSEHKNLSAQIVFMKSPKLEKLFNENPLVEKASLISRAKIIYDSKGVEAKLFGAKTSGHTFLFGEEGKLLFSGGITMARGHEGTSAGQIAIKNHLKGTQARSIASVFGCDIFEKLKSVVVENK